MPLSLYCRRIGSRLVPTDEAAEAEMRRLPELKVVKVSVVQERSARQNRFFHALCGKVSDAMTAMGADYATLEWVKEAIKTATGHFDEVRLSRPECRRLGVEFGATVRRGCSIDFDSMDHWEFSRWLDRVVAFTLTELLPHMPTNEWTREVERILDDEQRAAWVEHRKGRVAA